MKLIGVTLRPKTDEHNNIMFVSFRPQSYPNELYPILWDFKICYICVDEHYLFQAKILILNQNVVRLCVTHLGLSFCRIIFTCFLVIDTSEKKLSMQLFMTFCPQLSHMPKNTG